MAWTKLDSDAVLPDQPLSSFVGTRLADNVATYSTELSRLSTFVYPLTSVGDAQVKWASFAGRRGTVLVVDVGLNAYTYLFKVFCRTTNASLGGTINVRDLDANLIVSQPFAGSGTPTTVEIPYYNNYVSGLRAFHLTWESDVSAEPVGEVEVVGGVNNQVFCEDASGQFPFTYPTPSFNEMYHLLVMNTANTRPAPAVDALLRYQINSFTHNAGANRPPDGVLAVWPNLEVNPPTLPTDTSTGGAKILADIYELGRLELYSISVEVYGVDGRLLPPTSYQQTTPVNRINNGINGAMLNLQPNAGTMLSNGGFLGCLLPAGESATFAFFIQANKSVQQLNVSFRAVAYNQAQTAPTITFSVRDYLGNTVGTDVVLTDVPTPRVTGLESMQPRPGAGVFMNGVLAGDQNWGMRDAMDEDETLMGHPVRFTWGPNTQNDIEWGQDGATNAVYYGIITATSDLYIYGFNCRVL